MNKYELLVQEIFTSLFNKKGYSATRYLNNYIIVGYKNKNFVFEVFKSKMHKPRIEWQGNIILIKSYEEAIHTILLECLPF